MINRLFLCSALLLCFGLPAISSSAQNTEILSKDPSVARAFFREKNETITVTLLYELDFSIKPSSPMWPEESPRTNLSFIKALYTYQGRTPMRPQSVSFVILPRQKPKEAVSFSVSADGEVVHQGETLPLQSETDANGRKKTRKDITVSVPTDVFLRLAQAKKVEFKIGKSSEKLNGYQRKAVAALAVTINAIDK